ncbi:MAG: ribosome-associated translation inhibitor RaiA [Candidatus Nealsonbacteria bacterium]|nr:ribosome-associated translation inhibitor RaiA [Candidatus Nealsonbacteria bacterium]
MKTTIKATNLKLTPEIEKAIKEKISSLDKFIPHINMPLEAFVEVALETRHHQKGNIFYAEANIKVPGRVIRSEAKDEDIYKAINALKDELKLLLNKYKEKQIALRRRVKNE